MSVTLSKIIIEERKKLNFQSKKQTLKDLMDIEIKLVNEDQITLEEYEIRMDNLRDMVSKYDIRLLDNIEEVLKDTGRLFTFDSLYTHNSEFRNSVTGIEDVYVDIMDDN